MYSLFLSINILLRFKKSLSNKFPWHNYPFEVFYQCDIPKLMSNISDIYPFWDISKLKLTQVKSSQRWQGFHRWGKAQFGRLQHDKFQLLVNFNLGIPVHMVEFK